MSSKRRSQSGMASFLIVMIMMVVITLIVLGFSQVTRRNQREALDRQLSSQAFYAAESGVNATAATIANYVKTNGYTTLPSKPNCPYSYNPAGASTVTIPDLANGVRYTCVLVNPNPSRLIYNTTQTSSTVVPIQANGTLTSLTFSWNPQKGGTDTSCSNSNAKWFPAPASWDCDFAVLRVDLVANPATNIANLPGNTATVFMTPRGSQTLPTLTSSTDRASIVSATGCGGGQCNVTLNLTDAVSSYYVRVTSIYRDAPNMTISGTTASGTATFAGAQAVVDVTGQAQDELRRIQVRVKLTATADPETIPANALGSSASICKRFSILPTGNVDALNLCT